jgi:ketosteroid isomerase-like protein
VKHASPNECDQTARRAIRDGAARRASFTDQENTMNESSHTAIAVLNVAEATAVAVSRTADVAASRENARLLARYCEAYAALDTEAAAQLVAPDFVLHVPGRGAAAGEHWGADGFRRYMSLVHAQHSGTFDVEVPAFAVSGEHAFTREALQVSRAHDPDKLLTLRTSNWFKVRGGKLSEAWVIPEDQRAYDAYWTGAAAQGAGEPRAVRDGVSPRRRHVLDVERAMSTESMKRRELLEKMYDRFWRGDADAMHATVDDNVLVNITGRSAMSGRYRGWDGYMQFRRRLMAMAGPKYKLDVVALAAGGRDVFAVEYIRMNRSWDPTVREIYVLMHFEVDRGRVTRMDDFPLDLYAWERFFTPDIEWEA